jgi:hypothetical protein
LLFPLLAFGCRPELVRVEIDRNPGVRSMLVLIDPSVLGNPAGFDVIAIDDQDQGASSLPFIPSSGPKVRILRFDFDQALSALSLSPGLVPPLSPPDPGRPIPSGIAIQERLADHHGSTPWRAPDPTLRDPRSYRIPTGTFCEKFTVTPIPLPDLAAPTSSPPVIVPLDDHRAAILTSDGRPFLFERGQSTLAPLGTSSTSTTVTCGSLGPDGATVYLGGGATQVWTLTVDPPVLSPFKGAGGSDAWASLDGGPPVPGGFLRLFGATARGQLLRFRIVTWESDVLPIDPAPDPGTVKVLWVAPVEAMMVRHQNTVVHFTAGTPPDIEMEPITSATAAVPLSVVALAPALGTVALGDGGAIFLRTPTGTWRPFADVPGLGNPRDAVGYGAGLLASGDGGAIATLTSSTPCPVQSAWPRSIRSLHPLGTDVLAAPEPDGVHAVVLLISPS